jgi:3-hydroxyacyl-[acyl-carrier-protein] dehydratase
MTPNMEFPLVQKDILAFLPHRHPFLMVDRILDIQGPEGMDQEGSKNKIGIRVTGIKQVTATEPHFAGHFPTLPIMPGVLIVESMAQVASFSMYPSMREKAKDPKHGFQCFLVGVDEARFRVPVTPGDSLHIETEVVSCRSSLWTFECKATVEGKLVAEARIMANLVMNHG